MFNKKQEWIAIIISIAISILVVILNPFNLTGVLNDLILTIEIQPPERIIEENNPTPGEERIDIDWNRRDIDRLYKRISKLEQEIKDIKSPPKKVTKIPHINSDLGMSGICIEWDCNNPQLRKNAWCEEHRIDK